MLLQKRIFPKCISPTTVDTVYTILGTSLHLNPSTCCINGLICRWFFMKQFEYYNTILWLDTTDYFGNKISQFAKLKHVEVFFTKPRTAWWVEMKFPLEIKLFKWCHKGWFNHMSVFGAFFCSMTCSYFPVNLRTKWMTSFNWFNNGNWDWNRPDCDLEQSVIGNFQMWHYY